MSCHWPARRRLQIGARSDFCGERCERVGEYAIFITPPVDGSAEQRFHHLPMHVGEPVVAAAVAEGEAFVVEAEEVEDRGVKVVNADFVFHDRGADLVGRARRSARLLRRHLPSRRKSTR